MARRSTRAAALLLASLVAAASAATLAQGCGSTTVETQPEVDAGADAPEPTVTVLHPDAPPLPGESECEVTITTGIAVTKAIHVELCSPVDYPTNPPSGGHHWPVWAAYASYEIPVPREMYVHNMEHGAVVFLYKCAADCPDVVKALSTARASLPGDPQCLQSPEGPSQRALLTPDPLLDHPLAITAWGATYTATCLDPESMQAFAKDHYGKGPEATCAQGKLVGDPNGGAPICTDAGTGSGGNGGAGGTATGTGGNGGSFGDAGVDGG